MKHLSSQEVRTIWLNFFKERGHRIEPSASLIPQNDPTLLWINAGVAALKKYFDGSKVPPSKRITNVQKCIRTNDIENVGKTARHHTFFEMMGNFSIGDYFRKEIVHWAYEILTDEKYFALDKEKIYVTYHPNDLETRDLWIKEGLSEDHLIALENNFWQIGEGPCGPNTEVFFDRGEKYDEEKLGKKLLEDEIENDRYIEIWGIVFSQFNAENGKSREEYKELPHKNIDTGAGLERIACIVQETETNFETDLFFPIIEKTKELCNKEYSGDNLMPYRVIADHIRACTFALADGELFSNEGRGYVLRRLLRRAMRYGKKLGFEEPFLYKLVPTTIGIMKEFYPYLLEREEFLMKIIKSEEEKFIKTLNSGEVMLNSLIEGKTLLNGEDAFKLYDTYGFPIDLTIEICRDNNVEVDVDKFNECLLKQKELARNSRNVIESFNKQSKDLLEFNKPSEFIYSLGKLDVKVIGLFKDGVKVNELDEEGDIILDKTNFYGEMGGQVGDTGFGRSNDFEFDILNTLISPNKQHLHHIRMKFGTLHEGDTFELILDEKRRLNIMKNHSATHLLQSALRKIVGTDVHQRGSFVNDEYLRFDFSHFEKIDKDALDKVEDLVNFYIDEKIEQKTLELPIEEAKQLGALAEFNEKYGDIVRVVTFGEESKELCGGTHVKNTGDIGLFVIKSEESISSGVRRIEAYTGNRAYEELKARERILNMSKDLINVKSYGEVIDKIKADQENFKELTVSFNNLKNEYIKSIFDGVKHEIDRENTSFILKKFNNFNRESLLKFIDFIKSYTKDYVAVLVSENEKNNFVMVSVGKDSLTKGFNARNIMTTITKKCNGKGGGKDDLCQGNIVDLSSFNFTLKDFINE